jgi:hypothetical protein
MYFHGGPIVGGTICSHDDLLSRVNAFLKRYNARIVESDGLGLYSSTFECSSEDFLCMKLAEPKAIGHVHD